MRQTYIHSYEIQTAPRSLKGENLDHAEKVTGPKLKFNRRVLTCLSPLCLDESLCKTIHIQERNLPLSL